MAAAVITSPKPAEMESAAEPVAKEDDNVPVVPTEQPSEVSLATTRPFIEPQPIREEQVQNAVKFLSHPKVRGSPIVHRRSFLENKGLSREEINEAFRRVPDSPSNEAANNSLSSEGKPVVVPATQEQLRGSHPAITPAEAQRVVASAAPSEITQRSPRQQWSRLVVGVGLVAAAGAGAGVLFQRYLVPKLKTWIRKVALEDGEESKQSREAGKLAKATPMEEAAGAAAAAANAAAVAVAEVAAVNRELLKSRTEGWENLASIMKSLELQTKELRGALSSLALVPQELPQQPLSTVNGHVQDAKGMEYPMEYPKGHLNKFQASPLEHSQLRETVQPPGVTHVPISSSIAKSQVSNGSAGNLAFQEKTTTYSDNVKEEPWWRRKKPEVETFPLPEQRIASTAVPIIEEISAMSEGTSRGAASSINRSGGSVPSSFVAGGNNPMARQSWVPPPAPQVVMREAASAIRYQKVGMTESASQEGSSSYSFAEQDYLGIDEPTSLNRVLPEEIVEESETFQQPDAV